MKYVIPGDRYKNIKKQTIYQVFQVGNHSETSENLVCYVAVDSSTNPIKHRLGLLFLRLASRFLQVRPWFRPIELFEQKFVEIDR